MGFPESAKGMLREMLGGCVPCVTASPKLSVLPALGCFPGLGHLRCSGRQTQSPGRNEAVGVMPASPED